jgi:hypothetical protein
MRIIIILVLIVAIVFLSPLLIAAIWGWVVPDIFAGAVRQEILPAAITYWQAWKFVILLAVLGLTSRTGKSS